jgi:DNA modification methylase
MGDFSLNRMLIGDCRRTLEELPESLFQCCVTSPPYWKLRDYGHPDQIGMEPTPSEYVESLVDVFRLVRRALRDDGTVWLNLGDSYASSAGGGMGKNSAFLDREVARAGVYSKSPSKIAPGLKPKDICGIPWQVALALRDDGWYLRSDIIWCLSGGTVVYARTQKGDMPITVKDVARLNPATVKLWNGQKWTQVLGWSRTSRKADELELVLRSGERIACTPNHRFPTSHGLLRADEIQVGHTLQRVTLPEPDAPKTPAHVGNDAAWLAGLYLAEGSMSEDTIQIAGNASETDRLNRVLSVAQSYGGTATYTTDGNKQNIRVYGKLIVAIIAELVSGRTAKDKCLATVCWRYSNDFLRAYLDGYLAGDGHWDAKNERWRIVFTRNYNLERDLRVLSARLGFRLVLSPVMADGFGKKWPAFRGEIRFQRSGHWNEKDAEEVVEIRKARCRQVYDVGVEDDPHLFALSSGILTHNSKPNPKPESVEDRPTKSHEYVFLLSKSERYYYDADAIAEQATNKAPGNATHKGVDRYESGDETHRTMGGLLKVGAREKRNARTVWSIATQPYSGAHFATMPPRLAERCILAGSKIGSAVLDPFMGSGTTGAVAESLGRKWIGCELNESYGALIRQRTAQIGLPWTEEAEK